MLRDAVQHCKGCDLCERATQAVFGEGVKTSGLLFVGEQPGDEEDKQGRPFVGPAGRLFDRALADAGVDRRAAYVTNAVKHFRFEERGKRRIHKAPNRAQVSACKPWLDAEIQLIRPKLIVCLGRTAALSVFDKEVKLADWRGRILSRDEAGSLMVTIHPSFLLRLNEESGREAEYRRFVGELNAAQDYVSRAA